MSTQPPPRHRTKAGRATRANATQESLRESNLALVTAAIFASPKGISRAQVAHETSLTRATVSRLVDDLLDGGIVRENGQVAGAAGRPATMLVPSGRICALGLQVNATFRLARLITLDGEIQHEIHTPVDLVDSDPSAVLALLGRDADALTRRMRPDQRLIGAGLAVPGLVDPRGTLLRRAPNLGWSDVQLEPLLGMSSRLTTVGNEADLAAASLAHPVPGRLGPVEDFIYLSGEIGVGGSAVLFGQVMPGAHGWAGEIGHMCVDPAGPPCPCGSHGCLERFAGWRAFEDGAGLGRGATVDDFLALYDAGHDGAVGAVTRAIAALETALVSVINLLDIPTVIVGGHLGALGHVILPEVETRVRRRALSGHLDGTRVRITPHPTGGDLGAAASGAAIAVLNEVIRNPSVWLNDKRGKAPDPDPDHRRQDT